MNMVARYVVFALALSSTGFAQSVLRVTCDGENVGAEVSVNGLVKGTCPVDMLVEAGTTKLRLEKRIAGPTGISIKIMKSKR